MAQINPYINFNGTCREAMEFYKACLDASLNIQTIEGTPFEAKCPAGMKQQVMHAALEKDGLLLMGSDMTGPDGLHQGNNISITLNCDSEEQINRFFSKLSEGGKIIEPMKEQFWGALFGCFTDKFGIRWMLNFEKKPAAGNA